MSKFIMKPGGVIHEFIMDWDHQVNILAGAMNLGKGAAVVIKFQDYIRNRAPIVDGVRKSRFYGVRHDYKTFRRSTLSEMYKWFPHGSITPEETKVNDKTIEIKIRIQGNKEVPPVECDVYMVSLEQFKESDVLSMNMTGMIWSEVQECEKMAFFNTLYDRTGRYPYNQLPKLFIGDINYPDDDHWLFNVFVTDKENTTKNLKWKLHKLPPVIQYRDKDKPIMAESKHKDFVENPDAELPMHKKDYTYWWDIVFRGNVGEIRRKVIGEFAMVANDTPVYPNFNPDCIGRFKPIKGRRLLFGVDPGNGMNLAMVWGQVTPKGILRIYGCLSPKTTMSLERALNDLLIPIIKEELYPELQENGVIKTFGWRDPSDPQDRNTMKDTGDWIKKHTGITTTKTGTNATGARIDAVDHLIRNGMIEVDERAVDVIKGFMGGYFMQRGKPDKGKYSHVMNALEYLALGLREGFKEADDTSDMPVIYN